MIVKGIIDEDFVNYKKPAMVIECARCNMKCGQDNCQNADLLNCPDIHIENKLIVARYLENKITEAIVFQGLEPFKSTKDVLDIIMCLRKESDDDVVIYTGYDKPEVWAPITFLKDHHVKNIIVKYGRYISDRPPRYDDTLGVTLASDNQYAERIC